MATKPTKPTIKEKGRKTPLKIKDKRSMNEAEMAKRVGAAIAKRNLEKSRQYSPTPMTAAQKEKARRAGEKKSALIKMKNDPLVKGAKAALKVAANPVGTAAKVAGKVAGVYATGAKAMAKTVKDKVNPPKRGVGGGSKSGFTPAELAALKKMLSRGGNLDKPKNK
jgi:hypothetical protein